MTTQKLFSERLLDGKLIGNLTRRRFPHVLVAFLVNFFTTSVPMMMTRREFSPDIYTQAQIFENADSVLRLIFSINLIFMFVLGIYFGVVTMHYMMKRQSAQFWHALPQRRETLYFSSLVSALIAAAIGALINLLILLVLFSVYSLLGAAVMNLFWLLLFKNIVFFLAAYAVTVFAGSFSGSGVVQVLMSLVIQFYPLVTYSGMVMLRSTYAVYYDMDYYFSERILSWLSPATYAAVHYEDGLSAFSLVCAVLAIAALILGTAVIYRRRAIENTEKTIVFKRLGTVIKYLLLFVVTIFAGLFFRAITSVSDMLWMIFGFISGALLGSMLLNTILHKTPKAMFHGFRGLTVFSVCFALYFIIFGVDILKMDEYVPDADAISYAEITVNNISFEDRRFDDPELLEMLSEMLENTVEFDAQDLLNPYDRDVAFFRISVVMHTKLGIPIAREYSVSKAVPKTQPFLERYANDPRLNALLYEIDPMLEKYGNALRMTFSVQKNGEYTQFEAPVSEFLALYRAELGVLNYNRLRCPSLGEVDFYSPTVIYTNPNSAFPTPENDVWNEFRKISLTTYPLYADMERTIAWLEAQIKSVAGGDVEIENRNEDRITGGLLLDTSELVPTSDQENNASYPYHLTEQYCLRYDSTALDAKEAQRLYDAYSATGQVSYGLTSAFLEIDTTQLLVVFWNDYTLEKTMGTDGEEAVVADQKENGGYYEIVFVPLVRNKSGR